MLQAARIAGDFSAQRHIEQPHCNSRGTEHDQRAGKEHGAEPTPTCHYPQRRTGYARRKIEKCGVSPHREASALQWCAKNGFDAKSWVSQRIATKNEAGKVRGAALELAPEGASMVISDISDEVQQLSPKLLGNPK
jgi:hypothetical protein